MRSSTRPLLLLIAVLCVSHVAVGSFFKQVYKSSVTGFDLELAVITLSSDRLRFCLGHRRSRSVSVADILWSNG